YQDTGTSATVASNPPLCPDGAAAVYGPQKGIDASRIQAADATLAAAARILDPEVEHRDLPGAGAAGGTGFGLLLLGAEQRSGADAVFELVGVEALRGGAEGGGTGDGERDAPP